jgi:hypothetical protein
MKHLIIFLMTMNVAMAQEMPAYLKGAIIEVTLKNGKKYQYKSEEYAVVKRGAKKSAPALKAHVRYVEHRPNTIKVFGGAGTNGLKTTSDATSATITRTTGLNFGVGYERDLSERISLDVIGVGSKSGLESGLLGLGYKF